MGQQTYLERRRLQPPNALERCGKVARTEAETVHARVDLDPQHEAVRAGNLLEQLDLQGIVDHEIEAMARRFHQMLGREHPFEQHDRLCDPCRPQCEPLFQPRHPECIGFRQRQGGGHQAMPVGIGLHDGHDARAPRALANRPQIVPQGLSVDDRPDQPIHRSTPSA